MKEIFIAIERWIERGAKGVYQVGEGRGPQPNID